MEHFYPPQIVAQIANGQSASGPLPEDRLFNWAIAMGLPPFEALALVLKSPERAGRRAFAKGLEEDEARRQERLAARKPIVMTSVSERIAKARAEQLEGLGGVCKLFFVCSPSR